MHSKSVDRRLLMRSPDHQITNLCLYNPTRGILISLSIRAYCNKTYVSAISFSCHFSCFLSNGPQHKNSEFWDVFEPETISYLFLKGYQVKSYGHSTQGGHRFTAAPLLASVGLHTQLMEKGHMCTLIPFWRAKKYTWVPIQGPTYHIAPPLFILPLFMHLLFFVLQAFKSAADVNQVEV